MCCQKASTASATTACSPKAPAPTTSHAPASCSPLQNLKASLPLPLSIPASRAVHAAEVAWSSSRSSRAVALHGISRQLHRSWSGSTPHDRLTILQIWSSRSPAFDRPRQSTLRCPAGVSNRPTVRGVRRDPPLTHEPLHRRTTRCIGSIQISEPARGTQIPIAPAARPYVPLSAVSSLGGFRTPAAELAVPSLMRPASETLHISAVFDSWPVTSGLPD